MVVVKLIWNRQTRGLATSLLITCDRAQALRAKVLAGGKALDIPRRELAVFECLLERRGRIVGKSNLVDFVYGVGTDVDESSIEPHVSRLRRRLAGYAVGIKTARGLGYMLEESP